MIKSRDESWKGDTIIWFEEMIKNRRKCIHPVGGLIPESEDHEWEKLRDTLGKYGVNMNKGGLMFVVRWANMFLDASCPLAEELGYHPIGFTDDRVKMFAEVMDKLDKEHWVENTTSVRKEISEDMKHQVFLNLKSMLVKMKG